AQLFEGFHDTTWPLDMYGASTKGRRAVVSLDPAGGYDRARVFVQRGFEGELAQEVQGVDRTLLPIRTQRATIVHATLPQPMQATELVLKRQHGMLGQLDLYRAEPLKKAPAGKSLVSYAIAKADQLPDDMTGLTLQAQTPVRFWN